MTTDADPGVGADTVSPQPPAAPIRHPALPPGRTIELPTGPVRLRELPGPPGAPTIVLLHGWTATADLNFLQAYEALGERYRVLAFDHRGHGTGLRVRAPFRLEDCADDVAAMADVVGLDRFVVLGYSMGGAVAQLCWNRHRERVAGLVLCSTALHFSNRRNERLAFLGLASMARLARLTPGQIRTRLTEQFYLQRKTEGWEPWAADEFASHDWRAILEAGRAIGRFRSDEWIGDVDVPVSVVVTMADQVVPLRRQIRLFETIPGATAFRVDAGHDAAIGAPARWVPTAIRAIDSVTARHADTAT